MTGINLKFHSRKQPGRQFLAGVALVALLTCQITSGCISLPGRVRAADSAEANAFVKAFQTGDPKPFAGGEQVRLFINARVESKIVNVVGGSQVKTHTIDHLLVFLPRSVFLGADNGQAIVGSWRSVSSGFDVTLNGKTTAVRLSRAQNGQTLATGFGLTYGEVSRLSDANLVGRYETLSSAVSGGAGSPTISTSGKKALVLAPDHHFELSAESSTSVLAYGVSHGGAHNNVMRGKWQYAPTSFALILEPEGGQPRIAGLTCPSPVGWIVFNNDNWWRVNQTTSPD